MLDIWFQTLSKFSSCLSFCSMADFATRALRIWSICKGLAELILLVMSTLRFIVWLLVVLSIGLGIVLFVILSIHVFLSSDRSKSEWRGEPSSSSSSSSSSSECDQEGGEAEASSSPRNATPCVDYAYDVFLNHRGTDVKKTLASIIYRWLEDKGLRVFLDEEQMQVGGGLYPTIQRAIRSASLHIAIFSKRYAESAWCLDELCLMLKTGAKIIPVYFDVEPSDLRWVGIGQSAYGDAFSKHQNNGRHDPQKVENWKSALQHISYQHGLELNGPKINGNWGTLLKRIVDDVLQTRVAGVDLDVASVPVGLDEAIRDFEDFIGCRPQHIESQKVTIVGIVGLGGSGKTTLAKEFYNRKRRSYNCCSFLFDVKHAAARDTLLSLQRQLLEELMPNDRPKINSLAQGRGILRNRLAASSPRVLVILDDIDRECQLEDLLVPDVFGSGSLIITTSREMSPLLKLMPQSAVYKIKRLKENDAQTLFCSYAFQSSHPVPGFEDLLKNILIKCQGLPLSLKVMGAHLRTYGQNNKDYWEHELRNIAKIPPNDLKQMLQVSFDKLDGEEKQMFLDIACFFVGEDRDLAIRVWDGSIWTVISHLKSLEHKCLVEFDDRDRIKMHDNFRDFGREIASKESPYRLCHPDHRLTNVWEQQPKGRMHVRGILAATSDNTYGYSPVHSSYKPPWEEIQLSALKLLIIEGYHLENRFGKQLINLAWLRWNNCPYTRIPPWFPMKNLIVLHLINGALSDSELYDQQITLQLRELKVQSTRLSRISIREAVCPKLEHLDLCNNENLTEVQCLPTRLVKLNLNGCVVLKKIPRSFNLRNLQELDIGKCSELDDGLPNLAQLTFLKRLRADFCRKLRRIQGLKQLENLEKLEIRGCCELNTLPHLQHLRSLETIVAYGCNKLQKIQVLEPLSKLQWLGISDCSELHKLPDLGRLSSLKRLEADGCVKLQGIQGLHQLQHLTNLSLPANLDTATWDSIQQLKKFPSEMNLNGIMTGGGIESFDFPDLLVIDFKISEDEDNYYAFCNMPEMTACTSVIILFSQRASSNVCTDRYIHANLSPREKEFADCNSEDTSIRKGDWMEIHTNLSPREKVADCNSGGMSIRKGDWIDVSIFWQDSSIVKNLNRENPTTEFSMTKDKRHANAVVKGWMMVVREGKEGTIFEVLNNLFKHDTPLKHTSSPLKHRSRRRSRRIVCPSDQMIQCFNDGQESSERLNS